MEGRDDKFDLTRPEGRSKRRRLELVEDPARSHDTPGSGFDVSPAKAEQRDADRRLEEGPIRETVSRIQVPRRLEPPTPAPPSASQLEWRSPEDNGEPFAIEAPKTAFPASSPGGPVISAQAIDLVPFPERLAAPHPQAGRPGAQGGHDRATRRVGAALSLAVIAVAVAVVIAVTGTAPHTATLTAPAHSNPVVTTVHATAPPELAQLREQALALQATTTAKTAARIKTKTKDQAKRTTAHSDKRVKPTATVTAKSSPDAERSGDSTEASESPTSPSSSTSASDASASTPVAASTAAPASTSSTGSSAPAGPGGLGEVVGNNCDPSCSAN
jgi:hypothetical protein